MGRGDQLVGHFETFGRTILPVRFLSYFCKLITMVNIYDSGVYRLGGVPEALPKYLSYRKKNKKNVQKVVANVLRP